MEDWEEDEKHKEKLGLMACGAICAINIGIAIVAALVAAFRDPMPRPAAVEQVQAGPVDQAVVDTWKGAGLPAGEDPSQTPGLLTTDGSSTAE